MLTTELLTALADHTIDFADFARQTKGDFTAMATKIARAWGQLPPALQVEDLCQEMLLAVHVNLPDYDASRGDLRGFIVFRSCSAARKELRRHTRSKGRDARMPKVLDVQPATQEDSHMAHHLRDTLPHGDRQVAIINSLACTGSLDVTTAELLADPETRALFSNPEPDIARYSVYRTARVLAARATATA